MRLILRVVLPLLAVLGLLAWGAAALVNTTSRRWFREDVELRAALAVRGVREGLVEALSRRDRGRADQLLDVLVRDDRILAAAACSADLGPFARTTDFPEGLGCDAVGRQLRVAGAPPDSAAGWKRWDDERRLPAGRFHVSALPLRDGDRVPGFVVLLHDMSVADTREAISRWFLLLVFAVLSLAASLATVIVARSSWRQFAGEIVGLVRGRKPHRQFLPVLSDVRELVERIAEEAKAGDGGPWTADRLKRTLRLTLQGERVTLVANREPYVHQRDASGVVRLLHPASGLVTALEPVMRACSGVWIAHGSGSADREVADRQGRLRVPPGEESYTLRRVWLTPEEEKGYYYGFSNEGLWPLCHLAHTRPQFRIEDWSHYQAVNRKFADAVLEEVDGPDPIILVQDYHLALAPLMIRERLPRAAILTFWHTPWPNAESFGICPWQRDLLQGLLGSSIVGFHTQLHCNNFVEAVDRFLEARIDREDHAVVQRGRATLVRPYPISIEWPYRWARGAPPVAECRASVRAELGLGPEAVLGVGVDRLDYTKGLEERLLAVERLLDQQPRWRGRFTFVELAAPSRTAIPRYRELNDAVEALAERINARFARDGYRPVILLRRHHEPPDVVRFYRGADLCYVSSLHDGMNLVAKEFVASRDDERGVLVLSEFTGASRELTEALIVNPYDLEQAAAALAAALAMPAEEQAERMRALRRFIGEFNVYRWAGRMLQDAARLRQRERVAGRLTEVARPVESLS
ncbi:MAG: alpha,alpha-trehalose-phosphate synthase (UDP-forming) [Candidatus Polarisedimenticolia bacterium]